MKELNRIKKHDEKVRNIISIKEQASMKFLQIKYDKIFKVKNCYFHSQYIHKFIQDVKNESDNKFVILILSDDYGVCVCLEF